MISRTTGLAVNVRLGEVETVEHTRDNSLGVSVYYENRKGSASSTDFGATVGARDGGGGLPHRPATPLRTNSPDSPTPNGWRWTHRISVCSIPWPISTDEAIEIALETETAARDHDARITNSDGASVNRHDGDSCLRQLARVPGRLSRAAATA